MPNRHRNLRRPPPIGLLTRPSPSERATRPTPRRPLFANRSYRAASPFAVAAACPHSIRQPAAAVYCRSLIQTATILPSHLLSSSHLHPRPTCHNSTTVTPNTPSPLQSRGVHNSLPPSFAPVALLLPLGGLRPSCLLSPPSPPLPSLWALEGWVPLYPVHCWARGSPPPLPTPGQLAM